MAENRVFDSTLLAGLPADGRPLRPVVGTRPLDLHDWLVLDEDRTADLARKSDLLSSRPEAVSGQLPEGRNGAAEAREVLAAYLTRRFPELFVADGDCLVDLQTGLRTALTDDQPLRDTARLVQEDFVVMSRHPRGEWRMTAACVCFPSRWSLSEKLGQGLADIHGPVPFYGERLGASVPTMFDRLSTDSPKLRFNWTLIDSPELFQSQPPVGRERRPDEDPGSSLWVRIERQTLRRLPRSGDVLFTIRTFVRPLADLQQAQPRDLEALAATLTSTPRQTLEYKGIAEVVPDVARWLGAGGAPDSRGRECDSAPPAHP